MTYSYEYIDLYLLKDKNGNTKSVTFTKDCAEELENAVGWTIQVATVEAKLFDELLEDVVGIARYLLEL